MRAQLLFQMQFSVKDNIVVFAIITYFLALCFSLNTDLVYVNTKLTTENHKELLASHSIAIGRNLSAILENPDGVSTTVVSIESHEELRGILTLISQRRPHPRWRRSMYLLQVLYEADESNFTQIGNNMKTRSCLPGIDLQSNVFISSSSKLYEMYTLKRHPIINRINSVVSLDLAEVIPKESSIIRRKNFRGILINGVIQDDKALHLLAVFDSNGETPKFVSGLSVEYFELMATALNFSMGAVRGKGWIQKGTNGTLLGMAQQLLSGEADVCIANSEFLPYRLRGLHFLHAYYGGRIRAFFKQPNMSEIRNIFLHPFQPSVWISLLLMWFFIILCFKLSFFLKHKCMKFSQTGSMWEDGRVVNDSLWWVVSTICGQGWHVIPRSGCLKFIMLAGLTTYIFSYTAYSAAIVTSLSIFLTPIKRWADLSSNSSGYEIYGDALVQYSETFNGTVKQYKKTINITDALERMKKSESVAVISVYDQFYQIAGKAGYTPQFLCKIVTMVRVDGHKVKGGMIVPQRSPYKDHFNFITILIQERGYDSRLSNHYRRKWSPGCPKNKPLQGYRLGINDVFTAFCLLLFGLICSLCLLFIEKCSRVTRRRRDLLA